MMKKMSKIAIFSDLHLGVHSNSVMWQNIALEWVKWFARDLKSKQIETVIFCGDFFEHRDAVGVDTLHTAYNVLKELEDFNLIMFPGNHDCFFKDTSDVHSLSIFKNSRNITIIDKPTQMMLGSCNAFLCPWGTKYEEIQEADVIFGHFEVQTFKMNTFKLCENGLSVRKMLEKSSLIFSGHFHFRDERIFEIGTIVYVGNPFQADLNDSNNAKGYYLLDTETKDYEFVENTQSPLIYQFKLSNLVVRDTDIEEIIEKTHNNIITFIIDEEVTDEHISIIKTRLSSFKPRQINFEVVDVQSAVDIEQLHDVVIDTENMLVEFIQAMNFPNKQDLQDYAISLYRKYKKNFHK